MDYFAFEAAGCIATMSTMTLALRAQSLLRSAAIRTEVIPLRPEESKHGCAYGLRFDCEDDRALRRILRNARIPVSQFIKRESAP